jgi:gluconokinase
MPSTPAEPLILTLDIGTSSIRAMLFDGEARPIPGLDARVETPLRTTLDGGVELDADILVADLAGCIDEALARAGPLVPQIAAVAGASLVGNVLGVDADGRAVTPVYTWADTRGTDAARELREQLNEPTVYDRTGCPLRSSYAPALLRWLKRAEPALWQRTRRWMSIGEYFQLRLFGATAVSYSVASWSGMLDRRKLQWDPELLAVADLTPDQLSPLVDRDRPASGLRDEYARRWPSLASIPWFPVVGDGAASSAGCGCVRPRQMALALGTSGAIRVMVEHEIERIPHGLWAYRVDRRRSLLGGALSEGGILFSWLTDVLALDADPAKVEAVVASLAPDGHGLTVLPFLAGERSPGWHGDVRATIHGLSLHTQPVEILRAALESIGYRFAILRQLAQQAAPMAKEVIASGGPIVSSPAWTQIIADILGAPVQISAESEATSRGVAVLALEALGYIKRLDELPAAIAHTVQPIPGHHAIYQAGVERHGRLYDLLVEGTGKTEAIGDGQ